MCEDSKLTITEEEGPINLIFRDERVEEDDFFEMPDESGE